MHIEVLSSVHLRSALRVYSQLAGKKICPISVSHRQGVMNRRIRSKMFDLLMLES